MSGERNMYLDLFGIGMMLPMFFETYAGRIILTTIVLVSALKLFEVVMSEYYGRKAIEKNRQSVKEWKERAEQRDKTAL